MNIKPGKLVVFEGLDAAGKTTQVERLRPFMSDTLITHQPSGGTAVGDVVYRLTETGQRINPLARQLLHLASHAEAYDAEIAPALSTRGVLLDRCWLSTLAYGYYGSNLHLFADFDWWETLVRMPTQDITPDVVVWFMHPWHEDHHNTPALVEGYRSLIERYTGGKPEFASVFVKPQSVELVTASIVRALLREGVLELSPGEVGMWS